MAQAETLTRIHVLQEVYQQDYQSAVADRVLDKLIELERGQAERELMESWAILRAFEERHQMPSELFFERFQRGELGDDADLTRTFLNGARCMTCAGLFRSGWPSSPCLHCNERAGLS